MSETPIAKAFELTTRQKRLRTLTAIILAVILIMLAVAVYHPFFHPSAPAVLTEKARKALAVQGMFILGYISIIFIFALSLIVIVWIYIREIRLQLLMAQRDIWKDIVEKHAGAQRARASKRNGSEE